MRPDHMYRLAGLAGGLLLGCSLVLADSGKIPITTRSDEARKEFITGRSLFENLKRKESVPHFKKALTLDSEFALASAYLALSEGTARAFIENLERAARLAEHASGGERALILGWQAGGSGKIALQREQWETAVRLYPQDERALTQLGTHFFGQQEYVRAAECFKKAISLNPEYAQAYNLLGYSHRFLGDVAAAENAFKKYTTLIPDDPNPYDSYAELLLKVGRLDEAVILYRKALSINPNFSNSHIGIAAAHLYQDKPAEARKEMSALLAKAQDDTDRRQALFVNALSYIEEGKTEDAIREMKQQYALGQKINDAGAMAGDLVAMGTIQLEAGNVSAAEELYKKAFEVVQKSALPDAVKALNRLGNRYNAAVVAVAKGEYDAAMNAAEELSRGAESLGNKNQIRLAHEAQGRIALARKDYATAVNELANASQLNPYNLYRIGIAHAGLGQHEKARGFIKAAAEFSGLPQLNYALIRQKAQSMLAGM
jgi:tetratricopeptide (TPR) repeat protein